MKPPYVNLRYPCIAVVLVLVAGSIAWRLEARGPARNASAVELSTAAPAAAPQVPQAQVYQPVRGARVVRGPLRVGDEVVPDLVLVPIEAIITRGTQRREVVFLFRASGGALTGASEWRYITTGRRNDTHVEIVASEQFPAPEAGEIVLIGGHQYLAHETPVQLIESVPPSGGTSGKR